jgi:hypothetical protein
MRIQLHTFLCVLLWQGVSALQPVAAQIKVADYTFGGSSQEICSGVVPASDGSYLVGGCTFSDISGEVTIAPRAPLTGASGDYWIFKMDIQGNKLWEKRYGGDGDDRLIKILPAAHGGYLLCGWTSSAKGFDVTETSKGPINYWVVRIDALGNKRWDKRYGSATGEMLSTALATPDGGFMLTGATNSSPLTAPSGDRSQAIKGPSDIWTIKLDSLGNTQWEKTLGSLDGDYVYGAANTPGGGIALLGLPFGGPGGDVTGPSHGGYDLWLVRLDAAGNKVEDHLYGGSGDDAANALIATADGGLLLAGYTSSPASGDLSQGGPAPWLLKLDATGVIQWEKAYSSLTATLDYITTLSEYPGGGYILGGRTSQLSPYTYTLGDFELTHLSATGAVQWSRSRGGTGYELLNTVLPLYGGDCWP